MRSAGAAAHEQTFSRAQPCRSSREADALERGNLTAARATWAATQSREKQARSATAGSDSDAGAADDVGCDEVEPEPLQGVGSALLGSCTLGDADTRQANATSGCPRANFAASMSAKHTERGRQQALCLSVAPCLGPRRCVAETRPAGATRRRSPVRSAAALDAERTSVLRPYRCESTFFWSSRQSVRR